MKTKAILIAEKSSLMNDIKAIYMKHKDEFDFDVTFVCQSGHLLTLLLPNEIDEDQKAWKWENLPFHPKDYDGWKYKVIPSGAEKFNKIKEELNSGMYDFIIHAGDPDQEGELLVNLVLNYLGTKLPVKRFWTNSLTEKDILHALHNMEDDKSERLQNLYHSALARQHADYLIGMNITEAASLKMNILVPTGRCKSPICQIVCDREDEIENFVPKTDYELECKYKENFCGVLLDMESEKKEPKRFATKEELGDFSKQLGDTATVVSVQKKRVKQNAPELYNLSSLQVEASSKYGYTAEKTLSLVQSLYEKKFVSYPRTSCDVLSSNMDLKALLQSVREIPELTDVVDTVSEEMIETVYHTNKYIDDKKIQEHGHYALSPTEEKPDITQLTEEELSIMMMIYRRFLAIFLPPVIQDRTQIITKNNDVFFRSNGKILISEGYTKVLPRKFEDSELPDVKEGDTVNVFAFRAVEKTTTCPSRYTDGELIKVLEKPAKFLFDASYKELHENLHIGTDATRAGIIKQLIEKDQFLEYKKGKGKAQYICPTEKCRKVMKNFNDRAICRVDLSGQMEVNLDKIRKGQMSYLEYENIAYEFVKELILDIKGSDMIKQISMNSVCKCPKCNGDILESKKGYFCSNYKEGCSSKLFKTICGAEIGKKDIIALLEGKSIEKTLTKTDPETNETKKWKQKIKINFDELSYEFEKKSGICACPKCKTGTIMESEKGYYCTNYKEGCQGKMFKTVCGAKITTSDLQKMINGEVISKKMKRYDKVKKEEKTWTQKLRLNVEELCFEFVSE